MLSKIQISGANKGLKVILNDYVSDYNRICEESRRAYVATLAPGAVVPPAGRIYTEDDKQRMEALADGYRNKAATIIDGIMQELKDELTAAPSSDAVNTITLLRMRDEIKPGEVRDLLDKYGDNPQAHKTIISIAMDKGCHLDPFTDYTHPAERMGARVEDLKASIENYIDPDKTSNTLANIEGSRAFMDMNIDSALPAND